MRKVLLGVTTTYGSDWKAKMKEIKKLGLKEVAFFVTCLDKEQRKEYYDLAKETGVKAPFVHLRSDVDNEEIEYLMETFETKVFNLHTEREFPLDNDISKYKEKIYIENIFFGLLEEEVKSFGGICLDVSHLEEDRLSRPKIFKHNIEIIERSFIGCNHISAITKEVRFDEEEKVYRHDRHYLEDLSELDYLKKYPFSYFSDYVAIELENTLTEQLKIKKAIEEVINSKIGLVEYDSEWKNLFEKEKDLFEKKFGKVIIDVNHIGSTSIPGMIAKPIIDINVGVNSLEVVKEMEEGFEELGYEHKVLDPSRVKSENRKKIEEQELFIKKGYHVHVTVYNSDYWKKDLFFRDYITNNPLKAKEYAELKKNLAQRYPNDIIGYSSGKDNFITEVLEL